MKATEYLDAAQKALGEISSYELAKRINLSNDQISRIRKGSRTLPNHAIFKLAIILQLDPAEVLADLESQQEKTEERREFWRGFLLRVGKSSTVLYLLWSCIASFGTGPGAPFGREAMAYNACVVAVWVAFLWAFRIRIICIM